MNRIKPYKAYLFDLYGTLADIHTDEWKMSFWKKVREVFASCGAEYEAEELKTAYFTEVTRQEKERQEKGHETEIDLREVFVELLKKKETVLNEKDLEKLACRFREMSRSRLRLYAHAEELLQKLRRQGKQVYLLSNAQSIFTMEELRILKLEDLFDDILISSDCGYKKPDPLIFTILLDRNGLKAEDCLMIGNDLYSDVLGAARAGIDSYYIHDALSSRTEVKITPTYRQEGMDLKRLMNRICG